MKNVNFLFFLIAYILKMPMILSIRCCINFNCSLTKSCPSEVSHCKFVGRPSINTTDGYFIRAHNMELSYFDCWPWSHEAHLCPNKLGGCYSVYNHTVVKIFCCAGELCNNAQNLTCEMKNNDITLNVSIFPHYNPTTLPTFTDESSTISMTFIVLIIFLSVLVPVIIILRFTCKKNFTQFCHTFFKRPAMTNGGVSYVSDRTTYMTRLTNGNCSIIQLDMFSSNEISKASEYYVKCEKKCVGKFGEVWKGQLKANSTESKVESVAIKIFRPRDESSWETELEMYRYIRNRCQKIISYIGCDKIINYNEVVELWLVTQYIDRGSLYDYLIDKTNIRPKWSQVLRLSLDISAGLSYLHEDGSYQSSQHISGKPSIAHRDLKTRNVLLNGNWNACIADFGLAISFHGNLSPSELHLQVGTQRYMAPEVLEGSIHFSRDSFFSIDVYAMSLILWEIFSQCNEFENRTTCTVIDIPHYKQPFELELGSHITMDSLQGFVVNENKRPQMPFQYQGFEDGLVFWKTIVECWDRDAEARLSASCVYERMFRLSEKCAVLNEIERDNNKMVSNDSQPLLRYGVQEPMKSL